MAVPECASNEEIPRVANLSELDFHEEYFLKVQYLENLFRTLLYTLPCFYSKHSFLYSVLGVFLYGVSYLVCFLDLHVINRVILLNKDVYFFTFRRDRGFQFLKYFF